MQKEKVVRYIRNSIICTQIINLVLSGLIWYNTNSICLSLAFFLGFLFFSVILTTIVSDIILLTVYGCNDEELLCWADVEIGMKDILVAVIWLGTVLVLAYYGLS